MKVSKTENRFKTGFQQPKTGFPKKPVLTSLHVSKNCHKSYCFRLLQLSKSLKDACIWILINTLFTILRTNN